jgi:hypothetical protein
MTANRYLSLRATAKPEQVGDEFPMKKESAKTVQLGQSHKRPFVRQILDVSQVMVSGFNECLFTRHIINVSYIDI